MSKNRYYYYDHESCAFVELKTRRTKLYTHITALLVGALMLAGAITWGLDRLVETPQELALKAENEALQDHLRRVENRMSEFSQQLSHLSEIDQDLYRTLLQAEPISEDIRQVGTGGVDPYEEYSRFSSSTSDLLQETSQQLDQLERQVGLQNTSYRELQLLAHEHEERMSEMPAILPTDGPVVSSYGMRMHPILRFRRMHYGVDILVPTGTPVVAPGDGVIHDRGRGSSFGNFVKVLHPKSGHITIFAHLSRIPGNIKEGKRVKRGDLIGYSGNTGMSKSPHLHYEVRDIEGRALNPVFFFAPSMTPQRYREMLAATEASDMSLD